MKTPVGLEPKAGTHRSANRSKQQQLEQPLEDHTPEGERTLNRVARRTATTSEWAR